MTDDSKKKKREAYELLDKLSEEFRRAGLRTQKVHAASYQTLETAIVMIYGHPCDPMDFQKRVNPEQGRTLLRELKESFDAIATSEKQRGEDALIFKQGHFDKSEKFERFSGIIGTALQNLSTP